MRVSKDVKSQLLTARLEKNKNWMRKPLESKNILEQFFRSDLAQSTQQEDINDRTAKTSIRTSL